MERETATRGISLHSDDATPHPSLWGDGIPRASEPGVIRTSLEDSDDEPLDPNLDASFVPFPEDQEEEEQRQVSAASSGKGGY